MTRSKAFEYLKMEEIFHKRTSALFPRGDMPSELYDKLLLALLDDLDGDKDMAILTKLASEYGFKLSKENNGFFKAVN
jgi:hypothetical protein